MMPTLETSIATKAVHIRKGLTAGGIWACERPEAPPDDLTIWDLRCRACWLHAKACALQGIEPGGIGVSASDGSLAIRPLAQDVAEAGEWHER